MLRRLSSPSWAIVATVILAACSPDRATAPTPSLSAAETARLADVVRQLAAGRGIGPLTRPSVVRPALVRLGQSLVFDKVLSGNHDISCMTCHLPAFATGDARSLSIGQGATLLGPRRIHPQGLFIPRNAPSLFNLTALNSLFWDGRVSVDAQGVFHTPAGPQLTPDMTQVFEFGPVSALGLFPVQSREEMRAFSGNELASIPDADQQGIWRAEMRRLGAIPEYRRMFEAAYPGTPFTRMSFAHASNAMAGFFVDRMTMADSPWDRLLAGNDEALSQAELGGAQAFLSLKCSICHNGPAFSDNKFHNVALAQFGPGKGNGPSGRDDFGRENVTGSAAERYTFRTTPLRNVTLTAPYGHDGAFTVLHDFVDHYSESDLKLQQYNPLNIEPLLQGTILANAADILLTRDTLLTGVVLTPILVDDLTIFMGALTDPAVTRLDQLVPARVPSGLPVDQP